MPSSSRWQAAGVDHTQQLLCVDLRRCIGLPLTLLLGFKLNMTVVVSGMPFLRVRFPLTGELLLHAAGTLACSSAAVPASQTAAALCGTHES